MRIVIFLTLALLSMILTVPLAYSSDHPHQGISGMGQSSGMMMQGNNMGMMDMNRMQDRINTMQQLMERITRTGDPAKRQSLMLEHMQQMQKIMGDMHGMMGPGMMGNMSLEERHKFMGQRLDIMQQMMEQILEQQSQMMK